MQHHNYLPWLLEQIRLCAALIDHNGLDMVTVVDGLAQLYAEWSER